MLGLLPVPLDASSLYVGVMASLSFFGLQEMKMILAIKITESADKMIFFIFFSFFVSQIYRLK
jgi:hypothetical protein